jgi:serine/threonine protein kinase
LKFSNATSICDKKKTKNKKQKIENMVVFEDVFELKEIIGGGMTSVVHRCVRQSDGKEFAVKVIDTSELVAQMRDDSNMAKQREAKEAIVRIKREVALLQECEHENIVQLYEVYRSPSRLFIVLELCKGGELYELFLICGRLSERMARSIVVQIVRAVHYLHSKGIAHRDLKMESMFLQQVDID